MMWQMILEGCWHGMTWLDVDVDILYDKRIDLNNSLVSFVYIVR
jgi:hypothetical protein